MADFVIHGIPGSPYVRAALLICEEKHAPYTLVPMAFGDQRKPDHFARNPFQRIPVLEHGDFRLYETQAILRYLDRVIATPPLTPADPRSEARMNQIMGITDWYVMPNISAGISFQRLIAPMLNLPIDEARVAASLPMARTCVDEVARLLGDQPYMAGATMSLADLHIVPHLDYFAATAEGAEMLTPHTMLRRWLDRMRERSSLRETTMQRLRERVSDRS